MGKILLIRVNAVTHNEDDVKKYYPSLFNLAWNEKDKYIPASQRYGVLELITTLNESLQYANWSEETKELLQIDISHLAELKDNLQKLILDWKPAEANTLSFTIEEMLESLESKVKAGKIKELN